MNKKTTQNRKINPKLKEGVPKTKKQIENIRYSCKIVAEIIEKLHDLISEGITTIDIDRYVEELILSKNAIPAFKGYHDFPNAACISINDAVVHGIPNNRPLRNGDIVGVDIGSIYNDGYSDTAFTYLIGDVSEPVKKLCKVTQESLYIGIREAKVGKRVGDIGFAISEYIKPYGYGVVEEYCGHGVGSNVWEPPEIPNYGRRGSGAELRENMVIAIEPMINLGTKKIYVERDQWTVRTKDGLPSSHYEHTILITNAGPEILTRL